MRRLIAFWHERRQHEIVEQIKRVRGVNEVLTDFINLPARGGSG